MTRYAYRCKWAIEWTRIGSLITTFPIIEAEDKRIEACLDYHVATLQGHQVVESKQTKLPVGKIIQYRKKRSLLYTIENK